MQKRRAKILLRNLGIVAGCGICRDDYLLKMDIIKQMMIVLQPDEALVFIHSWVTHQETIHNIELLDVENKMVLSQITNLYSEYYKNLQEYMYNI